MNKEEQIKFQCWFTPWKIVIGDLKLMNVNWQDTTRTWLENSCGPGISLYVLKRIYMFTGKSTFAVSDFIHEIETYYPKLIKTFHKKEK